MAELKDEKGLLTEHTINFGMLVGFTDCIDSLFKIIDKKKAGGVPEIITKQEIEIIRTEYLGKFEIKRNN